MIELSGVSKVFETSEMFTHALSDINLTIAKSEYVSIQGSSGSGKSTLLNIIGLLDKPSTGSLTFDGVEVSQFSGSERAAFRADNLGFVFQSFNLLGDLNILDNVILPLKFSSKSIHKSIMHERAEEALERVGLTARLKHYPHQLSGGQQQRVAIARAIVSKPRLLLADEPTGNLDSTTGAQIMEMLSSLNQEGMTIVSVTHDNTHAQMASRVLKMSDGKLIGK